RWPDQTVPQQVHFDFEVDDLDEAEADLLELGIPAPAFPQVLAAVRVTSDGGAWLAMSLVARNHTSTDRGTDAVNAFTETLPC
ncbi:hypothetical protein ACWEQ8_38795, partial [Streptomyces noursei]